MAQPATNPKIEELRFRLKTDPKNRIFYPLAEELRKVGQFAEAEQVLRTGLTHHPTYLSAWVSLGRVLRETKDHTGAVEALNKALQLDPGNVVAARLLADNYLALGEKVEAIKKYKLVHALLPADEELEAVITRLDQELNPPAPVIADPPPADDTPWNEEQRVDEETGDVEPMSAAHAESPFEEPAPNFTAAALQVEAPEGIHISRAPLSAEVATVWSDETADLPPPEAPPIATEPVDIFAPAADEPLSSGATADAAVESPATESVAAPLSPPEAPPIAAEPADIFAPAAEEPFSSGATADAAVESPAAESVAAPPEAEPPPFEEPFVPEPPAEDLTDTLTMADLYARQGLSADARRIYEHILQRDPDNHDVRARLEALDASPPPPAPAGAQAKIAKLEGWLARVGRREVSRV